RRDADRCRLCLGDPRVPVVELGGAACIRPVTMPRPESREYHRMGDSLYRFQSVWQLHAPPDDVFHALARLPDYPLWWPEIKNVRAFGDDSFELVCKSTLPYELRFTTTQS